MNPLLGLPFLVVVCGLILPLLFLDGAVGYLALLWRNPRVVLVLDGGAVVEATRIGQFLRGALIGAWVRGAVRTRCVSACFFMFGNAV